MEFYSNESNLIFVELKPRVNPWKIDMYIYIYLREINLVLETCWLTYLLINNRFYTWLNIFYVFSIWFYGLSVNEYEYFVLSIEIKLTNIVDF